MNVNSAYTPPGASILIPIFACVPTEWRLSWSITVTGGRFDGRAP